MISKNSEKAKAVSLRKQGFSYTQILVQVPVAKSTLSLWLREVGLSKPQKQELTERRLAAARRGGLKKRQMRIEKTATIKDAARKEVPKFIKDPFWLAGVLLYWAEGKKQKEWLPSHGIAFTNTDADMLKLFQRWVCAYFKVRVLRYELYIHPSGDLKKAKIFWAEALEINVIDIRVYLKKHSVKTNRRNIGAAYRGTLRIWVPRSTQSNRVIEGWIEGVVQYLH